MDQNPPTVNKWDGNSLKNALDDAVKQVLLTRFEYEECNKLLDGRLLISVIAVGFSLFALLWDYLYPFPLSRNVLLLCAICYFLMIGVLTWYTSYIERGIFCTVLDKDPAGIEPTISWNATSHIKRFDSKYNLTIEQVLGGEYKEAHAVLPVEKFFDTEGTLLYSKLSKEVEKLHSDIQKKKN